MGDTNEEKELKEMLLDDKIMPVWISGVTDKTYNRNIKKNLETLEYFGDRNMSSKLAYYVFKLHPQLDEDEITNIHKEFLSEKYQSIWSKKIGINLWFRGFVPNGTKKHEDLFESMYGSLVISGNIVSEGLGEILGQNFISNIFKDIKLDEVLKDPGTRFKDLFQMKNWGYQNFSQKEQISYERRGKELILTVIMTQEAFKEISKTNNIKSKIIYQGSSFKELKEAKNEAFLKALEVLEGWGYNREDIINKRKKPYKTSKEVKKKMKEEGYEDINFHIIKYKNTDDVYYQLSATNIDSEEINILSFGYIKNEKEKSLMYSLTTKRIFETLEGMYMNNKRYTTKTIDGEKIKISNREILYEINSNVF